MGCFRAIAGYELNWKMSKSHRVILFLREHITAHIRFLFEGRNFQKPEVPGKLILGVISFLLWPLFLIHAHLAPSSQFLI